MFIPNNVPFFALLVLFGQKISLGMAPVCTFQFLDHMKLTNVALNTFLHFAFILTFIFTEMRKILPNINIDMVSKFLRLNFQL